MNNQSAFTLLELIMVVVLINLCLLLSLPSMNHFLLVQQRKTVINNLMLLIQTGKIMALQSGRVVSLCHSKSLQQCDGNWSDGQLLFFDDDEQHQPQNNLDIIQTAPAIHPQNQLIWHGFISNDYLQFNPTGYSLVQNGHFCYYQLTDPLLNRAMIISDTGRIRIDERDSTC